MADKLRTNFKLGDILSPEDVNRTNATINANLDSIKATEDAATSAATSASNAAQAAEDASGYLSNLQDAIQDLPDGQAVTAEVADHEVRVAGLEANAATKEEVTSKYGDYSDISEFLSITTDANDKILEGFKKDGTKMFTGDVDAPNIRQMVSDVAQAAQQTQQLSQDVVEKYGDYEDLSEYLEVKTDSEDRILEGTKADGTKVFMGNIDAPNIREMGQSVEEVKESTEWFDKDNSEEWAEITTDSQGRIIKGIKADGTVYVYKLDCPELDTTITNKIIEIVGNVNKNITLKTSYSFLPSEIRYRQGDATIPELTREVNGVETPITLTPVVCNNQSDFDTAINSNSDVLIILNTDVIVSSVDIPSNKTKSINGNGHKMIGGDVEYTATSIEGSYCKCEYPYNKSNYNSFEANYSYSVGDLIQAVKGNVTTYLECIVAHTSESDLATELNVNINKWSNKGGVTGTNLFVAPNGEVLRLARSRFYDAASRIVASDNIENRNGVVVYSAGDNFPQTGSAFGGDFAPDIEQGYACVYHCKFQLPKELQDIEISSADNVYINFTSDWMSIQTKVTKTEKTNGVNWIYFDYEQTTCGVTNYIGVDNDHYVGNIRSSFFLINYQMEDNHSALIKPVIENNVVVGQTLIFPSKYTKVYESINPMFDLTHSKIYLKISNAELIASRIILTQEPSPSCKIFVDKCKVHGCVWNAFDVRKVGKGYFTDNEVYDCEMGAFVTNNQSTSIVAIGNYIHFVGTRRFNTSAINGVINYYIARNKIEDFGYHAISVGIVNQYVSSGYKDSQGIVEYNEVGLTPDYFRNAKHYVPMDAGAIYLTTHHTECIVRHNTIIGYTGRTGNRGIYCDDGAYNIYVYSNIVANIPNSFAITARYASNRAYPGVPDNVNKRILNNYCENGIKIGGSTTENPNNCYLGFNLINTKMQTVKSEINGIDAECLETPFEIDMPSYQGVFSTSVNIQKWINNL